MRIFVRIVKKFYGVGVIVIAVDRSYAGIRIWRKRKMSEIKLKPCPFCGGKSRIINSVGRNSLWILGQMRGLRM